MFERFKRGNDSGGEGAVSAESATRERDETALHDREATATRDRDAALRARDRGDDDAGERDREPRFLRDDDGATATGAAATTDAGDTTMARPAGRHDLDRDGVDDRMERSGGTGGATRDLDRDGVDDRMERSGRTGAGTGSTTRDLDHDGVDDRPERRRPVRDRAAAGVVGADTMAAVRERQRERYGGFSWGSDFFGFLSALGLAAILTGILTGAGVAFGLFNQATGSDASSSDAKTIGIGGAIALLVVLAIAWYAGGYVAGRMARFDGARQGLGVWLWTLLLIVVVGVLAAIGGSKYDVLQSLNLPSIPVGGNTLTGAGAITAVLALLTMLIFAMLGGKVGERFHRKVDRVAHDEDYAYSR